MVKRISELEKNMASYEKLRSKLISESNGKIALLSGGELIDVFNDLSDAYKIGLQRFGEGEFSIKEIGAKAQNLGIMSYFAKPCMGSTSEKSA